LHSREYIASVPREEGNAYQKAGGKRILTLPYDYRIPKIRIVTAQAKKLSAERIVVRIDNWPTNSMGRHSPYSYQDFVT
jgi:DIS3-like exonuclease 1